MDDRSALQVSLHNHYLFAGLDEANFERLVRRIGVMSVGRREVLFHRGDVAESF